MVLSARLQTLEVYKSCSVGTGTPTMFSAVLIVHCILFPFCGICVLWVIMFTLCFYVCLYVYIYLQDVFACMNVQCARLYTHCHIPSAHPLVYVHVDVHPCTINSKDNPPFSIRLIPLVLSAISVAKPQCDCRDLSFGNNN